MHIHSPISRLAACALPLIGSLLLSSPAAADPPHARRAEAQAAQSPEDTRGLKLLHTFDKRSDSSNPSKPLSVGPDGLLYGISSVEGANDHGSLYRVSLSGETQTIYNFGTKHRVGASPSSNAVFGSDGALYGLSIDSRHGAVTTSIYRITVDGAYKLLRVLPREYREARGRILRASDGYFYGVADGYKRRFGWLDKGNGFIFRFDESGNFTTLHEMTKAEGIHIGEGLAEGSDGNFYGTTKAEGPYGSKGKGTVFRMTPQGQVTVLHAFSATGQEGDMAEGALVQAANGVFYGTTESGGANKLGTIFSIDAAGNFATLHSFKGGKDGASPDSGLTIAPDGFLYGETPSGGSLNEGTLFRISTSSSYETLHHFGGSAMNDGAKPLAALTVAPNALLYGTTYTGGGTPSEGPIGEGTVYRVTAAGNTEVVHAFNPQTPDGLWPRGGVVFASDGNMYGTTDTGTVFRLSRKGEFKTVLSSGSPAGASFKGDLVEMSPGVLLGRANTRGQFDNGSVYTVTFDGTVRVLHAFSDLNMNNGPVDVGLVKALDGNFYGTTQRGGANNQSGTVYRVTPDGSFATVFDFNTSDRSIGGWPVGKLALGPDGALYGVSQYGGEFNNGAVYKITTSGAFEQIHSFNYAVDGGSSGTGLVLASNGLFYGSNGYCSNQTGDRIFSVSPSGEFKSLHQFNSFDSQDHIGCEPVAALMQASDGYLYGTNTLGGLAYPHEFGTIFRMTLDGEVSPVVQFNGMNGATPEATLVQGADGALYGTAKEHGKWTTQGAQGNGVVFRLDIGAGPRLPTRNPKAAAPKPR